MEKATGLRILLLLLPPLYAFAQSPVSSPAEELPVVEFLEEGGFFEHELELRLAAPGADIYYTLNGNKPGRRSERYRGGIRIKRTTVVRAVAYKRGRRGPTIGHTYFIREPHSSFPVISLSLPSWVLFDRDQGLFMQGMRAVDSLMSMPGANFWSRKEVLVNTEIYHPGGRCLFRSETGMRLFGGMSRLFPQKSLALVARKRYGEPLFDYPLFGDRGPESVKFLVLRNSGSDWGKSHFRDGLMTGLLDNWDMETQAFQPAQVYINGDYWGIYNLREKINRYFIAAHQEVDKDSIDLIEHYLTLKRGHRSHYRRLLHFLQTHSLADPANFAYVESQMEIDNFLNYQIAQIYFDNQDAGGNIKFWRPQMPGGRWRWIMYDTDWGFGLHDAHAYRNNSLAFHTQPDGPTWPNPPWSTFILRKLLENQDFRLAFANRFADHLNTTFQSERVVTRIDSLYQLFLPEMPRHLRRWRLSRSKWEEQVQIMRTFALERPQHVWMHLMDRFPTGKIRRLRVEVEGGGAVVLNHNLYIRANSPFEGKYFEHLPVHLKVAPNYGYRFSHWEKTDLSDDAREWRLRLQEEETVVRAVFERYEHPLAGKVIINELSLNNRKSGDWIELYNSSKEPVSLRGWIFTDRNHEFVFPEVRIAPKDYLVLCQDSARFVSQFPEAYNVVGGMNFGLSKRSESLGLYADRQAGVDSVRFELPPSDSTFTLNLLLPNLDNSDLDNWEVRWGPGTPNAANPYYVESSIRRAQAGWMQVGLAFSVLILCLLLLSLRARGVF